MSLGGMFIEVPLAVLALDIVGGNLTGRLLWHGRTGFYCVRDVSRFANGSHERIMALSPIVRFLLRKILFRFHAFMVKLKYVQRERACGGNNGAKSDGAHQTCVVSLVAA